MKLTEKQTGEIEGFAQALQRMIFSITGENIIGKHYDPMTIGDGVMHSYAFDMKDGGRHHKLSDYESIDEIKDVLLNNALEYVEQFI